jgi:hypothetical protein
LCIAQEVRRPAEARDVRADRVLRCVASVWPYSVTSELTRTLKDLVHCHMLVASSTDLGRSRWMLILINGCGRAAPKYVVAFSDTIVGAWV